MLVLEEGCILIKSWIRGTLTEELLYLVSGLSTAKDVWRSLEEAFAQDTKDREGSLITRLHNYKKETSPISKSIRCFKGIRDELAGIQKPFRMMTRVAGWPLI